MKYRHVPSAVFAALGAIILIGAIPDRLHTIEYCQLQGVMACAFILLAILFKLSE